jgi:DNA-binding cell septation regulator SpoVG
MSWKVEVKKFYPFMLRMKNATLLGYADIVIDNLLEVRGIKLLKKDNGAIFILPPSVQNDNGTFGEVVKFVNSQLKEKIRKSLSEYYKERFGNP